MNLYLANGRYVGTQAEARKLDKNFTEEPVPTDKPSLIDYLNEMKAMTEALVDMAPRLTGHFQPGANIVMDAKSTARDMGASAVISRMDCPGVDVDVMVETIAKSSGATLRRFAGAVALRFAEIAEGGR